MTVAWWQETLEVRTRGRGMHDITAEVQRRVAGSGVSVGLCHLFLQHTSAGLALCENADPDVRRDMETFMQRVAPDGADWFTHTMEGPDDMAAHLRAQIAGPSLSLPVGAGRCALGTWQGIYLWEHRTSPHQRKLVITVNGERHPPALNHNGS